MAQRDLVVRFIGDDRDLQRAFTNSERRAKGFQVQVAGVGATLTRSFLRAGVAVGGTAAVFAGLRSSIDAASDLNEEIAKSEQVFGASSREINRWAQDTASSIGIARIEALRATGTFGNLFRVIGLAPEEAAKMSRRLVELTADLASFNNADPTEVLTAIRSGLIGEAEPLRRYGVLLSEARVQQIALEASGKKNVKALTDQEKALARYEIILQDTATAQGDFARTSDSLANQTRILRANLSDLAANLGGVVLPAINAVVGGVNSLFDGFSALADLADDPIELRVGMDASEVQEVRDAIASLRGESDLAVQALDEAIAKLRELESGGGALSPGAGIGQDIARRERERANEVERQALEADRERRRAKKAFDEFVKGIGLKLDKAQLTEALDDDLAALRELERAILRQIQREGRTFKLVEQLTAVRLQINSVVSERAANAAAQAEDAWQEMLAELDLNLQEAIDTTGLQDDLRALEKIERALLERIAQEGRTTELERQLLDIRKQQADVRREQADQIREARQGRQFVALGLTEEGDERTPGVGALRRRLQNLREQIKGTVLDTEKTRSQLQQIAKVLSGEFGAVGKEVREAILQMFNDISDAFDKGAKTGPQTRFQKRGVDQLLEGLGLSPEEIKALRQRFAQVGPGGTVPGQGIGAFGFAVPGTTGTGGGGNIIVNGNIVVEDPRDADAFIREVQKKAQRGGSSRRGPRAGSNRGMA